MSKSYLMKQCELVKGEVNTISWIPSKYAVKGKYLKLKNENQEWVDGWLIKTVGITKSSELILDMENSRRSSWVSLPPNGRI